MILAAGPSPLWYAARGAGAVTLVLLTLSVALGIAEQRGARPAGATRFAVAALHRTASLLAIVLLAVHIVTTLLDPFPHFALSTVFVPFTGAYRPLWVGFGALASDLLIALVITSLVRRRLGFAAWRGVHWAAYACWPVALLHGLGTGSDGHATWMVVLTVSCIAAVLAAVVLRLSDPEVRAPVRAGVLTGVLLATVGVAAWAQQGPLAKGWARRAGTPASVLAAFRPAAVRHVVPRPAPVHVPAPPQAFSASMRGRVRTGLSEDGRAVVDLRIRVQADPPRVLRVRIGGQPLEGGGVRMEHSSVSFGPPSRPREYQGRIQLLQDGALRALVGTRDGRAIDLQLALTLDGDAISGQIDGRPVT